MRNHLLVGVLCVLSGGLSCGRDLAGVARTEVEDVNTDGGDPDADVPDCVPTSCATPLVLSDQIGTQLLTGTLSCQGDTVQLMCSGLDNVEVVYQLSVAERRRLVAQASLESGEMLSLVLRQECDVSSDDLICLGDEANPSVDTFIDPGTYFLVLEAPSTGRYRLDVELDPQDTCLNPIVVELPPLNQSVTIEGDTTGASDAFRAGCASRGVGPDHAVRLRVEERARILIETLPPLRGEQFDTVLHVRPGCSEGEPLVEIACNDDGGTTLLSRVVQTFEPGDYVVVVDGFSAEASGAYRLRITHLPTAEPVLFPSANDTFSTFVEGVFSEVGDRVVGTRMPDRVEFSSAFDVDLLLQVPTIQCGSMTFEAKINTQVLGRFTVLPEVSRISQTFEVQGNIVRAPFTISYEVIESSRPGCGFTVFDSTRSSINFR